MRHFRFLFLALAGILLAACSLPEMAAKILPDDVESQMEEVIDAVIAHDFDTIKANGSDDFNAVENLEEGFNEIFEYIFTGEVESRKLVNAKFNSSSSLGSSSVTYYTGQYEINYADGSNIYTIVLVKNGDGQCCALQNVNVKKFSSSPSDMTKFTFKDKGMKHYFVLTLAILIPVFIIITLVKCARIKGLKRKWLWILFILVGVYGITFNWHTGQFGMSFFSKTETGVHFSFINFQILGAGFTKSGLLAPWMFEIGFPLGAVIFWFKSKKLAHADDETTP